MGGERQGWGGRGKGEEAKKKQKSYRRDVCMYVWSTLSAENDQPGTVAKPARGLVSRGNNVFAVPVRA